MEKIIVLSPDIGCESSKVLAQKLGAEWENPYETGCNNFSEYKTVFKYGVSKPVICHGKVFNKSKAVKIAKNKIKTFEALKDSEIAVPFTTSKEEAISWFNQGHFVVARNQTEGANGKGLTYCSDLDTLKNTPAKFWTKFVNGTHEFRVNIWKDKVLSIYNKIVTGDHFKFELYKGQENHPQLVSLVKKVYEKIKLDFGGLDIICDANGTLYLLEINSAPILFPYTLAKLVKEIKE